MGVWIEMYDCKKCLLEWLESLPVWECGLKFINGLGASWHYDVTPCVGVWIEILLSWQGGKRCFVTPCVGVWIEI